MGNPSHHLAAEIDTFTADDTPAIRQPAPPVTGRNDEQIPRRPSQVVPHSGSNVPGGWVLRRLKTNQQLPVTRVKTRIGTSAECELKLTGTCSDERQCVIEYDGSTWRLKQESKSQPLFVDGKPQTFAELKHGSKVTLADGSGFVLLNDEQHARRRQLLKRRLLTAAGLVTTAAIAATVWYFVFK